MDRRDFVKVAGGTFLMGTSCTYAFKILTESAAGWVDDSEAVKGRKWGMVIDLTKCEPGCTACMDACRIENNVSLHGDQRWDNHWIRKVKVKPEHESQGEAKDVILLCNHCDEPPCAQVCPVQATYKRHDGIVIVDHHRCIGCRYCMIACPYNARQFNFKETDEWPNKDRPRRSHGVAESCTLCAHRLDENRMPACVEACQKVGAGAIIVGDLNDPNSTISNLIATCATKRIREDLGTKPKVHYIGL